MWTPHACKPQRFSEVAVTNGRGRQCVLVVKIWYQLVTLQSAECFRTKLKFTGDCSYFFLLGLYFQKYRIKTFSFLKSSLTVLRQHEVMSLAIKCKLEINFRLLDFNVLKFLFLFFKKIKS